MRTTRQRAGKGARERGHEWERFLQGNLGLLARSGLCAWRKNPKQVRTIMGDDGQLQVITTGQGPPDFTVRTKAHHFELEAKRTKEARWRYADLKDHQAQQLDAWQVQGAICGLLVHIHGLNLAVPWPAIGPRWWAWHNQAGRAASGTASIHATELRSMGVEIDLGGTWLAWLADPTPIRGDVPRLPEEDPLTCQQSIC